MMIPAPCIDQTADWPTGCESVSAVMLLQYLGVEISVDEFIKEYLPCRLFEERDGKQIGADPRREFAGSPYDPDSMGCYAPVIKAALERVLTERAGQAERSSEEKRRAGQSDRSSEEKERAGQTDRSSEEKERAEQSDGICDEKGRAGQTDGSSDENQTGNPCWHVKDLTGVSMERICTEYLDRGRPVIFWACIDMKEPVMGPDWYLVDGTTVLTWISNEHCLLLVGYDEKNYYFNDPWEHHGTIGYEKTITEARHQAQYAMAVAAYRT